MIVFDVDGTLIGGESTDWASFDASFNDAAGFSPHAEFIESLEEVTAQAIVHQALATLSLDERRLKERSIRDGYLRRLKEAHARDPSSFPAAEGALALLQELRDQGVPVAIATGDWRDSISFKLTAAGIPFEDIPLVTSSEFYSRAEIISEAVRLSGFQLDDAIYVGDGLWDLRACRKLGIAFFGVGRRRELLRAAGATHILESLHPEEFWRIKAAMKVRGA